MRPHVPSELRLAVQQRAEFRCEYCHLPDDEAGQPNQIDHITSRKYGGATTLDNLAWACLWCNAAKCAEIAGVDPESGAATRLFNPRLDDWHEHFQAIEGRIEGISPIGRVTERALQFNRAEFVELRIQLMAEGRFT